MVLVDFLLISFCIGFAWDGVNFFVTVHMVLHFKFVIKTVLIMHWCCSCCWTVLTYTASRSSLFLMLPCQQVGWRCTRRWEGTQPGHLTSTKGYTTPCDIVISNKNCEERRRKGGCSSLWHFLPPKNAWWSPSFLEMGKNMSADGKYWANALFCFTCTQFIFHLLHRFYLSLQVFLVLYSNSLPHNDCVKSEEAVWGSADCQGWPTTHALLTVLWPLKRIICLKTE